MATNRLSRRCLLRSAIAASGATALTVALGACGQPAAPPTPTAAPAKSTPAPAPTAKPQAQATPTAKPQAQPTPQAQAKPASGGTVEITFAAHGDQSWQEFWNKVVDRFNKSQSKIKVTFQSEPTNTWQKYLTLMAGGTMYDTFRNEEKRLPEFVHRGKQLLDITSYAQADKDVNKEDFPPTVWDEFFWEGKMYGFGHDLSPAVIFINRKIFKDKGVPLPPTKWGDPKWDWNAFLETAKKLTYGEGAQKVFGVAGNTWWVYMHPWIWSNGGAVVLPDNKTVVLDSPEAVEAWEFYAALILQHKVMPIAAQATEGPDQLFESNRAAMDINNTSYTIRMRQMKDFDWDMAPFPTAKTGKVFDRVPNNVVSGYAKTKYPEESWQFLKFMGSKDATADARGMPARYSVANSDDFLKRTPNQNWQLLVDSGPIRKSEVLSPYFGEFDNTLRAAWESVQGGNKTVKQMVQEMKPKLTDILAGKTSQ